MSKSISIRPGWILSDTCSASGGVTYNRGVKDDREVGEGRETEFETTKHVDHVEIVKEANQVVNSGRYLLRKFCPTAWGNMYYADAETKTKVEAAFVPVKAQAEAVNDRARREGSARRVQVGFVALPLDLANAEAAAEIARTVRYRLDGLRDALRSGDQTKIRAAVIPCANLQKLATGVQADSIRFALETVATRRKELRERIEKKESPESAGRALDLETFDAAIALFSDPGDDSAGPALDEADGVVN